MASAGFLSLLPTCPGMLPTSRAVLSTCGARHADAGQVDDLGQSLAPPRREAPPSEGSAPPGRAASGPSATAWSAWLPGARAFARVLRFVGAAPGRGGARGRRQDQPPV